MKTSCGIVLKHGGKYLLGHTNGGSVPNAWTIFKGVRDAGETEEAAALREFREETGIDLTALGLTIEPLSSYTMKDKRVIVFLCEDRAGLTVNQKLVCESMVRPNYPEIDKFQWFTKEDAHKMVFNSQKYLFDT
jgi:8-oxo-dGTP pyrophosphatase MutT (NUDIX family)